MATLHTAGDGIHLKTACLGLLLACLCAVSTASAQAISYSQGSYAVPQTPQSSVTVAFPTAQTAGSLNVVAIGWNDATSQVLTVTDASGNTYAPALSPTVQAGVQSHAIYYAANVGAASSNAVTVTFNAAVNYPDVRIAEYRGIATAAPVDVASGATGAGSSSNSGTVTTTAANALLVGANYVTTTTTGAGAGFTSRMITAPNGSILEDRIVSTAGSYSATAPLNSGSWVMQLVAFRGAGGSSGSDLQPPTAPGTPVPNVVSSSRIDLAWPVATDNVGVTGYRVERCAGTGCSSYAEVATTTAASFSDTGLAAATSYSFRVRAVDAAGNVGPYSSTASAATPSAGDSVSPTAPGSLSAVPVSGTRINLAWTAATDNVGVVGYRVERCQGAGCTAFAQIGTTTTQLTYANTGLTNGTFYSYRVRATDAAGNLGAYSSVATAMSNDTQAPGAPTALSTNAASSSQIVLSWTAARDNVGVTIYRIARCQNSKCSNFSEIGTSPTTNFADGGLAASTTYRYRVRAQDAAGNVGSNSNVSTATTLAGPDTQPPTAPGALSGSSTSSTGATLAWSASTDNVAVTLYRVERCQAAGCVFAEVGTTATAGYVDSGLVGSTSYQYRVRAGDAAGNLSAYSPVASVTTAGAPHLSITQPTSGAVVVGSSVNVSYVSSGDQTEVNHVHFQLDGGSVLMDMTLDGIYQLTGVAPGAHVLTGVLVRADHSPIVGSDAVPVNFTTVADTEAPTTPPSSSASALSSSQINVTWTAATDNVGVAAYRVERCQGVGCVSFAEIAVVSTNSLGDTGLTSSTSYAYRVRAADAAGNLGGYSPTATATTLSPAPPVPISYAQGNYAVPQTPQSSVTVSFTGAQAAGSLNVVAIGWNDATSQVISVTDTRGNVYSPALSTTVQQGIQSHIVYYAAGVVASTSNAVTVTFNAAVSYPDVRIAEYRGIATSFPVVDVATGASGTGTTSDSGAASTTIANSLLVGANFVQTTTSAAGTGFTSRMITFPNGSILEDRIVSTTGIYSATAATQGAGWVMQLVAFRGLTGGTGDVEPPTAPGTLTPNVVSSTRIDLAWPSSSDNVAVTGYRIERCTGTGCSSFVEVGTTTSLSFSSIGLSPTTSYSFRVRAVDGAGNFGPYSAVASGTTPGAEPSSISIYLPADSSILSGNAEFGASVTGSVSAVQFQVDNVNVGAPVGPAGTLTVNTGQFANGSHIVRAYGWDSTNTIVQAAPVSVSFQNASPGNPAVSGLWSSPVDTDLVSINLTLMGNGKVLMYDRLDRGNPSPQVWNPTTSSFLSVPLPDGANIFCSGQTVLPDGRVFVAGGHLADDVGLPIGRIFDPVTNTWSSTPNMAASRWYPTVTTLPNGKVLVLSGEQNGAGDFARVPEVYDPVTNTWTSLSLASLAIPYYPHAFVLPNGRVAVTGTAEAAVPARVLDVSTQTWTTPTAQLFDAYSSAMYLPGKVLKTGKSTDSLSTNPSLASAYVIDLTAASPTWRSVSPMANPRAYHVETLLPDGTVLVTGGGRTTGDYDITNAVYAAELWSPVTEAWTTLASMQKPRLYHGSALLLPDGRVLVAGGGRSPGPDARDQQSLEIFAPPYLFKGARPTIASAPGVLTHNQAFTVTTPDAASVASVSLVAVGNMTHGINMSQRYLPLSFSAGAGNLTVTAPANANLAPPGIYMLFIVNSQGVPSMASFVRF